MAATAAGGFRRWFGTGKSLSFVRCYAVKKTSRSLGVGPTQNTSYSLTKYSTKFSPKKKNNAAALFEAGVKFCGNDGLDERQFKIEQLETHTTNTEAVSEWLLRLHPEANSNNRGRTTVFES